MTINFDLLGIPCAEYCERNGVKGIFIPEVPNFRYIPGGSYPRRGNPDRAIVCFNMFRVKKRKQKYDYMGRMGVWPEFQDAYLANPNTVNSRRYVAYGYNFVAGINEIPAPVSDANDFETLLKD